MTLPQPLPGVPYENLINSLREAAREAGNVHGNAAGGWSQLLATYRRWTQNTETTLALQVSPADLAVLVHTQRYWAIQAMPINNEALLPLIQFEVDERKRVLEEAAGTLESERKRWEWRQVIVVPDTNVFLHNPEQFDEMDWRAVADTSAEPSVVIPHVVVDELDRLKRTGRTGKDGKDDPRTRARQALRTLNNLLSGQPHQSVLLKSAPDSVRLDVLVDDLDYVRRPSADAEIVDRALYLKEVTGQRPVRLISDDLGMRLRAQMAGLEAYPSMATD